MLPISSNCVNNLLQPYAQDTQSKLNVSYFCTALEGLVIQFCYPVVTNALKALSHRVLRYVLF